MIQLLTNAVVRTMDDSLPVAEALAIRDGTIVEVGGTDEILWLREGDHEIVDLGGRTVLPGFVDPHNHLSIGALACFWADCRGARSLDDIQRRMRDAAAGTPDGAWVRGFGYDHERLPGRAHPTRRDLDAAVGDRSALLLHYSHHQGVVSTRGLAGCGISRATPDPRAGTITRDKAGEPTGVVYERALSRADRLSRESWADRFGDVVADATRAYAALGITTIQDAAVSPAMSARYARAREAGTLVIDVGELMVGSGGWFDPPDDAAPGILKLFVDGGHRCALRLSLGGVTREAGVLFYERDELAALLRDAWRGDRRVVLHAIGNVGVETAVGAIEEALRVEPAGRDRVRLDHAMFLTADLIARLRDLGIWVVAQPSFLWDRGATSPDPSLLFRAFETVRRAGVKQAFSSDFPCGSNPPFWGIAAAVTRRSADGALAAPDEAMPVEAALAAYTIDAARAAWLDDVCGSLTPGKRADLVVLSSDPVACDPATLASIRPVDIWASGRRVPGAP